MDVKDASGQEKTDQELQKIWNNARNQLIETQLQCEDLFKVLSKIRSEMDECQKVRLKLKFILTSVINQITFFDNCVLDAAISKDLIDTEWSTIVLIDTVNELKYWQEKISTKMKMLEKTKYELTNEHDDLSDFVCKDHVDVLQQKIDEIPVIKQQVNNIKQQYVSMKDKVENHSRKVKIKRLQQHFDTNFSAHSTLYRQLEVEFLSELNDYEEELADYLRSVTDHFDKCDLLRGGSIDDMDRTELLSIVKHDDIDLNGIKDILLETRRQITSFSRHFDSKMTVVREKVNEFQKMASKILSELERFEEYIMIFQNISDLISTYKETCTNNIAQVRELCQFYDKFKLGYKKLLSEKERRKAVAFQAKAILEECENQLTALNDDDINHRQLFLLENGDFLPENIWPGFIDDMSPVYKLEYKIKDDFS